jgi:hypothetical protein
MTQPPDSSADFRSAAQPLPPAGRGKRRRGSPTFSLRLTGEQRDRLQAEAGDLPLGAYIKDRLLPEGKSVRIRRAAPTVQDRRMLAHALAALGASRISSNLNQLAHLANIGVLTVTPEIAEELREALRHVADIRMMLMRALGKHPESRPSCVAPAPEESP